MKTLNVHKVLIPQIRLASWAIGSNAAALMAGCWMTVTGLGAASALAQERTLRFAVIGDMDPEGSRTKAIAKLIETYANEPVDPAAPQGETKGIDFILTVGDNNYESSTVYDDLAKLFAKYVRAPQDNPKPEDLSFFPTLGNHDYEKGGGGKFDPERLKKIEKTFAVPPGDGGIHYYEFRRGPIHFFALDSNDIRVKKGGKTNVIWDGAKLDSKQHQWFRQRVEEVKRDSSAPWRIAFFHHPPAHSGVEHASESKPMAAWKLENDVSAVLCGHAHFYERIDNAGIPFFITGAGGTGLYRFQTTPEKLAPGSRKRHPNPFPENKTLAHFGALFGEATKEKLRFEYRNGLNQIIDQWPE